MAFCKSVWLVDDDEMTHYLVEVTLLQNDFATNFKTFTSGKQALAALDVSLKLHQLPDFIFLDLSMPTFDGWDFLDHYRNLPMEVKNATTVYILSSSIDEQDINKSKLYVDVRDFLFKPLSRKDLEIVKFQSQARGTAENETISPP